MAGNRFAQIIDKAVNEAKDAEARKILGELKEAVAKYERLHDNASITRAGDERALTQQEWEVMEGFKGELAARLRDFSFNKLKPKDVEELGEIHHLTKAVYTIALQKLDKEDYSKQKGMVQAGKSDITLNSRGVITDFAKKHEKSKYGKLAGWALIIAGIMGVTLGVVLLAMPATTASGVLTIQQSLGLLGAGASLVGGGLAIGLGTHLTSEKSESKLSKAAAGFLKMQPEGNKGLKGSAPAASESPKKR